MSANDDQMLADVLQKFVNCWQSASICFVDILYFDVFCYILSSSCLVSTTITLYCILISLFSQNPLITACIHSSALDGPTREVRRCGSTRRWASRTSWPRLASPRAKITDREMSVAAGTWNSVSPSYSRAAIRYSSRHGSDRVPARPWKSLASKLFGHPPESYPSIF